MKLLVKTILRMKLIIYLQQQVQNLHPKNSQPSIKRYIKRANSGMEDKPFTVSELRDTFVILNISKNTGYDDISFNVVKNCFRGSYVTH